MEKQLKVIMVGPDRSVHGGISGVVNGYYKAGLQKKIQLKYIGTMREGSKIKKLSIAAMAFFRFLLLLPRYDIVHIHMASDNSYRRKSFFVKGAAALGKKIIIHQHGGNIRTYYHSQLSDKGREKMKKLLNMADIFLVLTPEWEAFFKEIVAAEKIQVFPNCISVGSAESLTEKEYGVHKLLFLGRLCSDKGLKELFSCVQSVGARFPDVKLYLGGIWEEQKLREEAEKYPERISYLGWLAGEQKDHMLKECDLFVLPSYYEGQPVSVLEAMACGCAVIASDVGGIPDMIEDGISGLLIEPRSEVALTKAVERALSDAELCRRLGEQARIRVENSFSLDKSLERLREIYETISADQCDRSGV